jgi:hypothetical protein
VSLPPRQNLLEDKSDPEALLPADMPADSITHDELPRIEAQERFRLAQLDEASLFPLIEFKQSGRYPSGPKHSTWTKQASNYTLDNGLLHRQVTLHGGRDQYLALVVATTLQHYILGLFHNHPLSAHFGASKIIGRFRPRFWWNGMDTDCDRWAASCLDCRKQKSVADRSAGLPGVLLRFYAPGIAFRKTI